MTTLEDLIACEKEAVDPSREQVTRLESRIGAALGIGVSVASVTSLGASTEASSLLAKLGSALLSKPAIMWGAGAVAGVGLGYSVAVMTAASVEDSAPLVPSSQLTESPAPTPETPEAVSAETPVQIEEPAELAPEEEPRVTRPAPEQAPSTSPVDRLKQDAQLLSQVSASLNQGNPSGALKLMEQAQLKGSPLGTEFKAARAIALCQLGRSAEARNIVQSLKATAPESPALLRVTQACGENN